MNKTPIDPEIEREAREIYAHILAERNDNARATLSELDSKRTRVASALIHVKCRWPARVARIMDSAFCVLIFVTSIVVPLAVGVVVGQKRYWYFFSFDFFSYCLVAAATLIAEFVIINSIFTAFAKMPFVIARDRADKVKVEIARDALLAETESGPELIAALLDARMAFAANKDWDETVFDAALERHLKAAETSPELIGVLLDARAACAENKDYDETVLDPDIQAHLKNGIGATDLNDSQKLSMLNCLKAATWHLVDYGRDEDDNHSDAKRKLANVGIALAIIEFYQHHVDESALDAINGIAKCEPVRVSPKWKPVIEAARKVPGVKFVEVPRMTKEPGSDASKQAEDSDSPITGTVYNVTRAFEVAEVEDEGMHFFLELADGSVLLMSGQDIYDYELTEYPGFIQSRFPCTKIIIRESDNQWFCAGEPLDYVRLPAKFWEVWGQGYPEDMMRFKDVTFDELLRVGERCRDK